MKKHHTPGAIPEGYMKIGEMAKKAGVTVRTLQYYDKEGLLSPSGESEGGFRLYNDKDMVKLVQILMMKDLGFPLKEIKKRLDALDTPADVVNALTEHAADIRRKIEILTASLEAIEALKDEVAQMDSVDFKKYAAILINLQMKNKQYWIVKYFDDEILDHIEKHMDMDTAAALMEISNSYSDKSMELRKRGVAPESEEGQAFARELWEMMLKLVNGDIDMLMKLHEQVQKGHSDKNWDEDFVAATLFMQKAMEAYLFGDGMGLPEKNLSTEKTAELLKYLDRFKNAAEELQKRGIPPESEETQAFAKELWATMLEITNGDYNMMREITAQAHKNYPKDSFESANIYMKKALEIHLNPGGNNK